MFSTYFEKTNFHGIDISTEGVKNSNILKTENFEDSFFEGWPIKTESKLSRNVNFKEQNAKKLSFKAAQQLFFCFYRLF